MTQIQQILLVFRFKKQLLVQSGFFLPPHGYCSSLWEGMRRHRSLSCRSLNKVGAVISTHSVERQSYIATYNHTGSWDADLPSVQRNSKSATVTWYSYLVSQASVSVLCGIPCSYSPPFPPGLGLQVCTIIGLSFQYLRYRIHTSGVVRQLSR